MLILNDCLYRAFLGHIPVQRRVSDYVHCAARVVNAVLKRLTTWAAAESAQARAALSRFIQSVADDAAQIPVDDRIAPRRTKQGSVDLTGACLFLQAPTCLGQLVDLVQGHAKGATVSFGGQNVFVYVLLRILLTALHHIHQLWCHHHPLTDSQLQDYGKHVCSFTRTWRALTWKPTVWVHWMCAHSAFFLTQFRSMYLFSSIPSEKRHQTFKLDLRHCFKGWKLSRAYLHHRGLVHVIKLSALDQGLVLQKLKRDKRGTVAKRVKF